MLRILAISALVLFAVGCGSGDSGCGGSEKKDAPGESSSMPGGGGGGGGGLGEPVSFQGVGKKQEPPPPQQAPAASAPAPAAPAAGSSSGGTGGGAAPADGPQTVICGGFTDLPADCFKDPAYEKIKKKCCPTGQVERCQGIPGGARLTGRNCTAAAP